MRVPPPGRRVTYSPTRATTSVAWRSSAIDSSRMRPATASFTSTRRENPTRPKGEGTRRVTGHCTHDPRRWLSGRASRRRGPVRVLGPEEVEGLPAEEQGEAEDGPDGPEVVAAAHRPDDEQHRGEQAIPDERTAWAALASACPAAGGCAGDPVPPVAGPGVTAAAGGWIGGGRR